MKECELCTKEARMYCEADQASLCFQCDEMVHGANFLVARHTRCLLCAKCQDPTPWKASGPRLGITADACGKCAWGRCPACIDEIEGRETGVERQESEDELENEEEEEEELFSEEEDDDGENQVVPLSNAGEVPAPPVSTSSSATDKSSSSAFSFEFNRGDGDLDGAYTSKRKRGI